MECGARIEEHGWRQGSFLPPELVARALPAGGNAAPTADGCFHVVVTQSCDLVNKSLDDEPWCEVMCLRPIPKTTSLRESGRNPRFLHLEILHGGVTTFCEAAAKDRLFLPRKALETRPPLTTVEIENRYLNVLTDWLAKRYSRTALPTNFNRRLKSQENPLKKLLDSGHEHFRGFYLRISDYGELPEDKPYLIKLLLVAKVEAFRNNEAEVRRTVKDFEAILKKCSGVDVLEVKLQSDAQTSLKTVDDYLPWDSYDFLTIRVDLSDTQPAAAKV